MILYRCDLCNEVRECAPKEIEHTEYDICAECWHALEQKLAGKGRRRKGREIVTPHPSFIVEPSERRERFPGETPEIIGASGMTN